MRQLRLAVVSLPSTRQAPAEVPILQPALRELQLDFAWCLPGTALPGLCAFARARSSSSPAALLCNSARLQGHVTRAVHLCKQLWSWLPDNRKGKARPEGQKRAAAPSRGWSPYPARTASVPPMLSVCLFVPHRSMPLSKALPPVMQTDAAWVRAADGRSCLLQLDVAPARPFQGEARRVCPVDPCQLAHAVPKQCS